MEILKFLKRIFDRKISDRTIRGYNAEKIKSWLTDVAEIDSFKYYYYRPSSKFPADSKILENQPTGEVLSFLNSHFSESPKFVIEIQRKVYKSGRQEVILRGIASEGEILKIGVLNAKTTRE